MGTPSFALPSLQALLGSRHRVAAVVTRPDRPAGRGLDLTAPPVKTLAAKAGVTVLQPEKIRDPDLLGTVRGLAPDAIVVVAFGRILPKDLLDAAPMGGVNVHASLLPRYRGASPVAWAIASGETETGVTTMRMTEKLDAGDILLQESTPIGEEETTGMLEERLAAMGASLLIDTLDALGAGTLAFLPQKEEAATFAPILKKEDARIDWGWEAKVIARRARAFDPWPVAFTTSRGKGMQIWKARAWVPAGGAGGSAALRPGEVLYAGPEGVRVACGGASVLNLLEVQPEGRRRIRSAEAAAGRYFAAGDVLGG